MLTCTRTGWNTPRQSRVRFVLRGGCEGTSTMPSQWRDRRHGARFVCGLGHVTRLLEEEMARNTFRQFAIGLLLVVGASSVSAQNKAPSKESAAPPTQNQVVKQ